MAKSATPRKPKTQAPKPANDVPLKPVIVSFEALHGESGKWHPIIQYDASLTDENTGEFLFPRPQEIMAAWSDGVAAGKATMTLSGNIMVILGHYGLLRYNLIPVQPQ